MPFTTAQIDQGGYTQIDYFLKNDPIDQVNTDRPFLDWLMKNKQPAPGGNQYLVEQVYFSNDSNYQNYFGADPVTFNERDTVRQAKYPWYDNFDGFGLDEDALAANGIIVTDDAEAVASQAEKFQLTNLLKTNQRALKEGYQEKLDQELSLDGSQNSKACPGLDLLVSMTPSTGTVGTLDASSYTWWRNQAHTSVATADLIDTMHTTLRDQIRIGKMPPDAYFCGGDFLDAYRAKAGDTVNRQISGVSGLQKGGVTLDATVTGTFFNGRPLLWNPTFDVLDTLYSPSIAWSKRCYGLQSKAISLRPVTGAWMVQRKPKRLPDRFVHYWGLSSKYRMTTNRRVVNSVIAIA